MDKTCLIKRTNAKSPSQRILKKKIPAGVEPETPLHFSHDTSKAISREKWLQKTRWMVIDKAIGRS